MEDLKIIQLYWEREESAIIQTKEKYGKTMEQLAYRLLFDYQDTEECCSDTYWDLWNALPPNRPIHFKAFIMRICRCNAMNRLERREAKTNKEYIFEPSIEAVLRSLLPKSLNIKIYQSLLENTASEHSARMTAMQSASDNAKDILDELTLDYNRVRQSIITQELTEIIGGSNALK